MYIRIRKRLTLMNVCLVGRHFLKHHFFAYAFCNMFISICHQVHTQILFEEITNTPNAHPPPPVFANIQFHLHLLIRVQEKALHSQNVKGNF